MKVCCMSCLCFLILIVSLFFFVLVIGLCFRKCLIYLDCLVFLSFRRCLCFLLFRSSFGLLNQKLWFLLFQSVVLVVVVVVSGVKYVVMMRLSRRDDRVSFDVIVGCVVCVFLFWFICSSFVVCCRLRVFLGQYEQCSVVVCFVCVWSF